MKSNENAQTIVHALPRFTTTYIPRRSVCAQSTDTHGNIRLLYIRGGNSVMFEPTIFKRLQSYEKESRVKHEMVKKIFFFDCGVKIVIFRKK